MLRIMLIALLLVPTALADDPKPEPKPEPLKYADYFDVAKGTQRTYTGASGEITVTIEKRVVKDGKVTMFVALKQGEKTGRMVERVEKNGFYRGTIRGTQIFGSYFFKGPLAKTTVHSPVPGATMKIVSLDTVVAAGGKKYNCIVFQFSQKNAKFYFAKGVGMVLVTVDVKAGEETKTIDMVRLKTLVVPKPEEKKDPPKKD